MAGLVGFRGARTARDGYALALWQKHGLGEHPSFEEMEPVIEQLLGNPSTKLEAASIALGRRVDAREKEIGIMLIGDPEDAFCALLVQHDAEIMEENSSAASH